MKPFHILVVDDNAINMKLFTTVLKLAGHEVYTAEDADSALNVIATAPLDLILMDLALPGMDGLSLTRKLKADEKTRSIPIVALTAFAMKGDDKKAYEAGCDGYISKPINTRAFPEQVARYLPKLAHDES